MTGQRGAIFKTEKQASPGNSSTVANPDGASIADEVGVSLTGAQGALQEGNKGVSLGDPQIQKPSTIHERAR